LRVLRRPARIHRHFVLGRQSISPLDRSDGCRLPTPCSSQGATTWLPASTASTLGADQRVRHMYKPVNVR